MTAQLTTKQLLTLAQQGQLFGTVFQTLGGHNGRGYWGHGAGIPATVQQCPAGLAVYLNGAFKCVIGAGKPIYTNGALVWWGSAVTLHIGAAPAANMQRAPL